MWLEVLLTLLVCKAAEPISSQETVPDAAVAVILLAETVSVCLIYIRRVNSQNTLKATSAVTVSESTVIKTINQAINQSLNQSITSLDIKTYLCATLGGQSIKHTTTTNQHDDDMYTDTQYCCEHVTELRYARLR